MGKKNKPKADHVRQKRDGQVKKQNPFEIKINRQKHDILGRKVGKFEKGNPGISRAKASKKRKKTLLKEYEQQHKSNRFVDKRIGEHDASLSLEEKMMKRYAVERSRNTGHNKFSLNDEEELTHYGQSLADIEKFDEPVISDNDEDDDDKRAAAKLVAEQHFGGFMKKKNPEDDKKSWKERMEEVIGESKKKKYEKQMEKEATVKMTEEVDSQWSALHSLLHPNKQKRDRIEEPVTKADDYDIAVRSLAFEMKGQPTDRLKTEEEIAKEEKEKLDKLEADRLRRMKGIVDDDREVKPTHRSADDLDDGFSLEPKLDFDYVSYKDGQLLQEMGKGDGNDDAEDDDNEDDADEDDNEDDDDNAEDDNEDGSEDEKVESDLKDDDDDDDDNDDDDDGEEDENDYEDLESDTEQPDEVEDKVEKKTKKSLPVDKDKIIEAAKKELPYTFKAPESYDELLETLEGHDLQDQLTIIERIRKCHHPSLAEGNKKRMETLFELLVQFYCDLCIQDPPQLDFADRLVPHLYQLTQMSPENAEHVIVSNMSDRQEEFAQICRKKAGRGLYPGLDTLMLFKLISILFPTSDFRHRVTTSAMIFMCMVLGQSPVNHGRDVVAGLLICNLCLEYVSMSKRYIPEVITFLHGLLFYAANKEKNKLEDVRPPFKPVGDSINLLHVSTKQSKSIETKWSLTKMLAPVVDDDLYNTEIFRLQAIDMSVRLIAEFHKLYKDLCTYEEVFSPVVCMLNKLPSDKYPETLQVAKSGLVTEMEENSKKTFRPMVMQKKKVKPLKLFEPKFDEGFDGRKKGKRGTRDFNEKQKLVHKHKKEMKGAMRELKKDTKFLAREKLGKQMRLDEARKRKVREIMGGLAHQEGEYKKMKLGKRPDEEKGGKSDGN